MRRTFLAAVLPLWIHLLWGFAMGVVFGYGIWGE